jgi:hypothetical protein
MKNRTLKAIERMLCRAIPTAPIAVEYKWFTRLNWVRFDIKQNRTAMREARKLVSEAQPLMSRYEVSLWQKI